MNNITFAVLIDDRYSYRTHIYALLARTEEEARAEFVAMVDRAGADVDADNPKELRVHDGTWRTIMHDYEVPSVARNLR